MNFVLRLVGKVIPADVAGDDGVAGHADDVILQAAVALAADGAQLPLSGVDHLVAAQILRLREAFPTGGARIRPHLPVHQLVARQVADVVEALPTHVADEGLLEVGQAVSFEHADAGVASDVAVAGLLSSVPRLDMLVAMSLVVEPLWAEAAGERQHAVLLEPLLPELQDAAERCSAHRAHRVRLLLVVDEPPCVRKQHLALRALEGTSCFVYFLLPFAMFSAAALTLRGADRQG